MFFVFWGSSIISTPAKTVLLRPNWLLTITSAWKHCKQGQGGFSLRLMLFHGNKCWWCFLIWAAVFHCTYAVVWGVCVSRSELYTAHLRLQYIQFHSDKNLLSSPSAAHVCSAFTHFISLVASFSKYASLNTLYWKNIRKWF